MKFLRRLDAEFPAPVPLHLVIDNYGTHKKTRSAQLAEKTPAFRGAFCTHQFQWLNLIERWFGEQTQKAVRRGVFLSVPDLVQPIEDFLSAWNQNRKPFAWDSEREDNLNKIERARTKLEAIAPGCTQPRRRKKRGRIIV